MESLTEYVIFLRALASTERVSILQAIELEGELSVTDVQHKFYMEQSTASHHLNILKKASILSVRKAGRNMFYSINEQNLKNLYKDFLLKLHEKQAEKMKQITEKTQTRDAATV